MHRPFLSYTIQFSFHASRRLRRRPAGPGGTAAGHANAHANALVQRAAGARSEAAEDAAPGDRPQHLAATATGRAEDGPSP